MGKIVNLIAQSKTLLSKESGEDRQVKGVICDRDGVPLTRDEMHRAREVYMDQFSGAHFMRVSHTEKEAIMKADGEDGEFYQGVGEVHGWFVPAPDYTLKGRYGDAAPSEDHEEEIVSV